MSDPAASLIFTDRFSDGISTLQVTEPEAGTKQFGPMT